jgi:hypothetical protein
VVSGVASLVLLLLLLAGETGGTGDTGAPAPLPTGDPSPLIARAAEVTERLAGALSRRAGREVEVPRLDYVPAAARRAALRERWSAGLPWTVDPRYRLLLFHLRLLDPGGDPRETLDRYLPEEPGPVASLDGSRLLLPEWMARAVLPAKDPLLEAVGVAEVEVRLLAEIARAAAARRLLAGASDDPDDRAARWSLTEAYARLAALDLVLRAGGVMPESLGAGLLSVEPDVALAPVDREAARSEPGIFTVHLIHGPEEAYRYLVQRLLEDGWSAVEATLDSPPRGTSGLHRNPRPVQGELLPEPEEGMRRMVALPLGPRTVYLLCRLCGGGEEACERNADDLASDRAALDRGPLSTFLWSLRFRGGQEAASFARRWSGCMESRWGASSISGIGTEDQPVLYRWPGGQARISLSGASVQVAETIADEAAEAGDAGGPGPAPSP